jgi:hypothetical protein
MRGHFRYPHFKTFPTTPRTPQCEVFCPFLSSSKHSGVPVDSKSQLFQVLGFTPTLGQVRVATQLVLGNKFHKCTSTIIFPCMPSQLSGKMGGKNNNLNKLVQSDKCFSIILGTTFAHKYVRMQ